MLFFPRPSGGGLMPKAYASFCRPLNLDTATMLLSNMRALAFEQTQGKPSWDTVHLSVASGGGAIMAGLALYNSLRGMPFELHTHNTASVDLAAILIFLAGKKRFAAPISSFHFHEVAWTFAGKDDLPLTVISDAHRWLRLHQETMARAVSEASSLSREAVLDMMDKGATLTAEEAKKCGMVHEICEDEFPPLCPRWVQI